MAEVSLSRSAIVVLDKLYKEGPLTPKEISEKSDIPLRTVSLALKKLRKCDLAKRIPNLHDMRLASYTINPEKLRDLQSNFDQWRTMSRLYLKVM